LSARPSAGEPREIEGFAALAGVLRPFITHPELRAQVTWAALYALAVLRRGDRIPPEAPAARTDLLIARPSDNYPKWLGCS
jgi:hypothetical protein